MKRWMTAGLVAIVAGLVGAAKAPTDKLTSSDQFHLSAKKTAFSPFDNDPVGQSPKGWMFESAGAKAPPVPWQVKTLLQALSPPHVFASAGVGDPDNLHVALLQNRAPLNGEITAHFKVLPLGTSWVTSLVWRWQSPEMFYELQIDPREDQVRLYRWLKGKRKVIDTKSVIYIPEKWHVVRVIFLYQTYSVFVDDQLCMAGEDKKILTPGGVGLAAPADAQFFADDVLLKE